MLNHREGRDGELGNRAGRQGGDELLGDLSPGVEVVGGVGGAEALGDLSGDVDLVVALVGGDGLGEAALWRSLRCSAPALRMLRMP